MRPLIRSFHFAIQGMAHALLTQRNMRIHFFAAFIVGLACVFVRVSVFETIALFFSVALVITLELVNTAIESAIDLFSRDFHERAKIAKDVAAASVFVAAANALLVAYLVFYNKVFPIQWRPFTTLIAPPFLGVLLFGFLCLLLAVVAHAMQIHLDLRKGGHL